jgi:hypothetical protein
MMVEQKAAIASFFLIFSHLLLEQGIKVHIAVFLSVC